MGYQTEAPANEQMGVYDDTKPLSNHKEQIMQDLKNIRINGQVRKRSRIDPALVAAAGHDLRSLPQNLSHNALSADSEN